MSSPSWTRHCSRINWRISESGPGIAEAGYRNAELAREVAELALHEYTDAGPKGEDEDLRQEVAGLRAAIRKGEGRLERTQAASKRLNDALAKAGRGPDAGRYRRRARDPGSPRRCRAGPGP